MIAIDLLLLAKRTTVVLLGALVLLSVYTGLGISVANNINDLNPRLHEANAQGTQATPLQAGGSGSTSSGGQVSPNSPPVTGNVKVSNSTVQAPSSTQSVPTSSTTTPSAATPRVGSTITTALCAPVTPGKTGYYEGEKRIISISGVQFAFYYNCSNVVYRYSTDGGKTWSAQITAQAPGGQPTGQIGDDVNRWTMVSTKRCGVSCTDYLSILYFTPVQSGAVYLKSLRGSVSYSTITWDSAPTQQNSLPVYSSCNGACVAIVANDDTNGNIFAAYRYVDPLSLSYHFGVLKASDGGKIFFQSLCDVDSGSPYRIEMAVGRLTGTGQMGLVYMSYNDAYARLYGYDGTGSTCSGWYVYNNPIPNPGGLIANAFKQISGDTDTVDSGCPCLYIAYGGDHSTPPNTLYTMYFHGTVPGSISWTWWRLDTSRLYYLPSLSSTAQGDYNGTGSTSKPWIRIYAADSTNTVYESDEHDLNAYAPYLVWGPLTFLDQLSSASSSPFFTYVESTNNWVIVPYSGFSASNGGSSRGANNCSPTGDHCTQWDLTTGRMRLFSSQPQNLNLVSREFIEFNSSPLPGNSPTNWGSTSHTVTWGSTFSSAGYLDGAAIPAPQNLGAAYTGIELYRCASTTGSCTSAQWAAATFVTFIGTEVSESNGRSRTVSVYDMDYNTQYSQAANYIYAGTPFGETYAKDRGGGTVIADFGGVNYLTTGRGMQFHNVYAR